jgi:tetratricopeptide (TPR) repeat protein
LEAAAAEWQSKSDDQRQKFLLRSGQLIIAEDWATSQGGNERMTELEALFLKASTDERDAEEDRKAKVDRRLKFLSIGATAAAIIAMVIGGFAFQQKEKAIAGEKKAAAARDAAKEAETKTGQIASHSEYLHGCELIASGNEDRALTSFAKALNSSPDNREAATRLISLLGQRSWPRLIATLQHANRVECLAATPDGRHLFVATGQPRSSGDADSMSAVQAYDLGSLKLMIKPKIDSEDAIEAPIERFAVNATGDRIMAVRSRYNPIRPGAIELFDANSGRMIKSFEATNADGDELLDKCFFSNDGRYMLYFR